MFQAMKLEKRLKISKNIVFQKFSVQFLKKVDYSKKQSKHAFMVKLTCSIAHFFQN